MRKIKGDGTENYEGSVDSGSLQSSAIGTELNRKITVIKQKGQARIFHIRRYSGIPLIHPTNKKHDYIQTGDLPFPAP